MQYEPDVSVILNPTISTDANRNWHLAKVIYPIVKNHLGFAHMNNAHEMLWQYFASPLYEKENSHVS